MSSPRIAYPPSPPPAPGGGGAPVDAQYVTLAADATLTNERVLTAGANVTIVDGGPGSTVTISAAGGGGPGGGAPVDAQYVTLAADPTLTNERVLTAGANVTIVDGGPGNAITISAAGGGGGGGAPVDAQYIVGAADVNLTAERVVTATPTVTWDLTVAGQAQANVPDTAITYSKIQNVTASRVLGRGSASAGPPQELTVGTGLSLTGTTLSATPPPTSAPVNAQYLVGAADATLTAERVVTDTSSVAWDLTNAAQARATVPNGGISYAQMQNVAAASRLLGRGSAAGAGAPEEITVGTGLTMSGTTLSATAPPAAAPVGAQYVTLATDPTLTSERVLTAGTNITIVDGGANGPVTISAAGGGGGAPTNASFITAAAEAGLTNERVLTAGSGITLTDGGPGGAMTIAATGGGGGGPTGIVVLKVPADITVNNSTVLVPITGLELTLAPNELWFVEYDCLAFTGVTPDIKWGFINPADITIQWGQIATVASVFYFNTPSGTAHVVPVDASGTLVNEGHATADNMFHFRAYIRSGATGGQAAFAFAQNAANASNTIVRLGSNGLARRVIP